MACLESTGKVSLLYRKYLRNFFGEPNQHLMDHCSSGGDLAMEELVLCEDMRSKSDEQRRKYGVD